MVPDAVWALERTRQCLADVAAAGSFVGEELLSPPDASDALLVEMMQPMEAGQLRQILEQLHGSCSASLRVTPVIQNLVQLAQIEGPLKLMGAPSQPVDLQTFNNHLTALSSQLSLLHDPKLLGAYLQSRHFKRSKYELFALQHMQLLVWLQRLQVALLGGVSKSGTELQQFIAQMGHAARVMLFQPLLLHTLQIVRYSQSLTAEEISGNMAQAMQYPPEQASDADRVEWLQLNLLLQFQSVFRDALCNPAIYQPQYSPGEANLFAGFLRLEEIYTHLIGRFPASCPLDEAQQTLLTQMCTKLNKFFNEGKQYKSLLEHDAHGKQLMLQLQQQKGVAAGNPQFVVREWILPFMLTFTDLLKVLWTLWTQLKQKRHASEAQRRSVEGIARVVGNCLVQQLEEASHAATAKPPEPSDRMPAFAGFRGDPSETDEMIPHPTPQEEPEPPPSPQQQQQQQSRPTQQQPAPPQPQTTQQQQQPPPSQQGAQGVLQQQLQQLHLQQQQQRPSQPPPPISQQQQQQLQQLQQLQQQQQEQQQQQQQQQQQLQQLLLQQQQQQQQQQQALDGLELESGSSGGGWASVVRRPATEAMPAAPAPSAVALAPTQPSPAAKQRSSSATSSSSSTDEQVRALVIKREQARAARDFDSADRLREQLSQLGVTLDDQNKIWRSTDGRSGPITAINISELHAQKAAKAGAANLSDEEIDRLVKEREQARFTSDYKTADRLRDQLEKHGVHLDTKENKWQAADGRSGPIGPVNISAAHAQKAARAGAPKLPVEEIEKILVQREQARARRDYKTADVLREQLEKHGVYLDAKEKKWHSADGRSGAIVVSTLSNEEIGRILANRQAARLRHDFKTADRLRDQLNEQGLSVDDKRNRWESSDGRCGSIDPFTSELAPLPNDAELGLPGFEDETTAAHLSPATAAAAAAGSISVVPPTPAPASTATLAAAGVALASKTSELQAAGSPGKTERKKGLTEKERRELAKQLRGITGASARLCEKALQSHADDMERAADWLLSQGEQKGGVANEIASESGRSDVASLESQEVGGADLGVGSLDESGNGDTTPTPTTLAFIQHLQQQQHICALVLSHADALPQQPFAQYLRLFPHTERGRTEEQGDIFYTSFPSFAERDKAEHAVRQVAAVKAVERCLLAPADDGGKPRLLHLELSPAPNAAAQSRELTDERLRTAIEHMLNLQREGQQQQLTQMMEAAQNLGVTVDLLSKRWVTADGRAGSTDPFCIDSRGGDSEAAAEAAAAPEEAAATATPGERAAAAAAPPQPQQSQPQPPAPSGQPQLLSMLDEAKLQQIIQITLDLGRSGQQQQLVQVLGEAKKQCVAVTLTRQSYHATHPTPSHHSHPAIPVPSPPRFRGGTSTSPCTAVCGKSWHIGVLDGPRIHVTAVRVCAGLAWQSISHSRRGIQQMVALGGRSPSPSTRLHPRGTRRVTAYRRPRRTGVSWRRCRWIACSRW